MARVTVEDCVLKVPNRFELVMMAANRAKSLEKGSQITVDRDNDKNTVVALREIADGTVSLEALKDSLVTDLQKIKEKEPEPAPKEEEVKAIDLVTDDLMISEDEDSIIAAGMNEVTEESTSDEQE